MRNRCLVLTGVRGRDRHPRSVAGAHGGTGAIADTADAGRPSRSVGNVRSRHADAARAAGGAACGSVGRGSRETRKDMAESRAKGEQRHPRRPRGAAERWRRLGRPGGQRRAATTRSGSIAERTTAPSTARNGASIVIDPPDGQVPSLTAGGAPARAAAASAARPTSDASESNDPGLEPPGSYDDPERRPLGERCLLGFGSTSGPPVAAELLLQQPPPDCADAGLAA